MLHERSGTGLALGTAPMGARAMAPDVTHARRRRNRVPHPAGPGRYGCVSKFTKGLMSPKSTLPSALMSPFSISQSGKAVW